MQETFTDRNVYILGAGFSATAQAPLLYNFLDKSRELMDDPASGLDRLERDEFQKVFDFRRKMAQAREKVKMDLDNIEQLFGLVEMQQRLGLGNSDARGATVYLIAKTLELTIARYRRENRIPFSANTLVAGSEEVVQSLGVPRQEGYNPPKYWLDVYDFFAMLIGGCFDDPGKRANRKDTVITFNYDLVLDHALRRAAIPVNYHLPPGNVSPPAANVDGGISLLKLHGSTNWGICGECKEQIQVSTDKVTSSPSIFRNSECRGCGARSFQPMLVPPSWDKTEYQDLMRPVWNRAVLELQRATRICVIGYSLPESDAYFKYLLTLGLSENHGLYKFTVVDYAQGPAYDGINAEEPRVSPTEMLLKRYRDMLEDLFQERRFGFNKDGLWLWMHRGAALGQLGRGEMINIG